MPLYSWILEVKNIDLAEKGLSPDPRLALIKTQCPLSNTCPPPAHDIGTLSVAITDLHIAQIPKLPSYPFIDLRK